MVRVLLALGALGALAAAAVLGAGCGGSFPLPTERRVGRTIPTDSSYKIVAIWSGSEPPPRGMGGIKDILLTQGSGTQLYLLFNRGGKGLSRGAIYGYSRVASTGSPQPLPESYIKFSHDPSSLFNPVALCSAGGHVYVLNQGDTLLARSPDSTHFIVDLSSYWFVHEYGLLGDPMTESFSDTSVAFVNGIAADAEGGVYVSGVAVVYVPFPDNPNPAFDTKTFQNRIYRYKRGPRYPGIPDLNIVGNWHRDTTWLAEEGSGIGYVSDPRGLNWTRGGELGPPGLYVADAGKNVVAKLSDIQPSTGFFQIEGSGEGPTLTSPSSVSVDLRGYVYVADTGNHRVLRFSPEGEFIQRVDLEPSPVQQPVAVAANDSVVFVADRALSQVFRYQRVK